MRRALVISGLILVLVINYSYAQMGHGMMRQTEKEMEHEHMMEQKEMMGKGHMMEHEKMMDDMMGNIHNMYEEIWEEKNRNTKCKRCQSS
jgi:hypothetical protein